MSNYAEFWAGTDPLDARSVLQLDASSGPVSGHMQLRWQSVAGKGYTVQYSSDLVSWSNVGDFVEGDGSLLSVSDPAAIPPNGQRFYRIALTGF